ncbi:MAG: NusG domain II-containing protein [Clostridia bacterium]|nr:NusG domain II-containing protein [Clostridia bacterium]
MKRIPISVWMDGLIVLLVIGAAALFAFWPRGGGQTARVTTPTESFTLPLSRDDTRTVEGKDGLTLVIEVQDGAVRVKEADCPDKLCVQTGWLKAAGQTAACLPAGITVTVEGERDVDAVI